MTSLMSFTSAHTQKEGERQRRSGCARPGAGERQRRTRAAGGQGPRPKHMLGCVLLGCMLLLQLRGRPAVC